MADPPPAQENPSPGPPRAEDFDAIYAAATVPPWDIGRPQPPFAQLARSGGFVGKVLDIGCGTGEHALLAASLGHDVMGIDVSARARFVRSLATAVKVGGRYHMLCFSDRQPGDWGPRRVTQAEIRASFADGWVVDSIEPVVLDITIDPPHVLAWQVAATRTEA